MFRYGPMYRNENVPWRLSGSLISGTPSVHHTDMSGAARLSIHRNESSRKKTLSWRQKYNPIMIGICARSSRHPPIAA